MAQSILVFFVTFIVFTFEGLLHYNIGKNGLKSHRDIILPPMIEFCKIICIVFVFSLIDIIILRLLT
jgi:hypothetical protein